MTLQEFIILCVQNDIEIKYKSYWRDKSKMVFTARRYFDDEQGTFLELQIEFSFSSIEYELNAWQHVWERVQRELVNYKAA